MIKENFDNTESGKSLGLGPENKVTKAEEIAYDKGFADGVQFALGGKEHLSDEYMTFVKDRVVDSFQQFWALKRIYDNFLLKESPEQALEKVKKIITENPLLPVIVYITNNINTKEVSDEEKDVAIDETKENINELVPDLEGKYNYFVEVLNDQNLSVETFNKIMEEIDSTLEELNKANRI